MGGVRKDLLPTIILLKKLRNETKEDETEIETNTTYCRRSKSLKLDCHTDCHHRPRRSQFVSLWGWIDKNCFSLSLFHFQPCDSRWKSTQLLKISSFYYLKGGRMKASTIVLKISSSPCRWKSTQLLKISSSRLLNRRWMKSSTHLLKISSPRSLVVRRRSACTSLLDFKNDLCFDEILLYNWCRVAK